MQPMADPYRTKGGRPNRMSDGSNPNRKPTQIQYLIQPKKNPTKCPNPASDYTKIPISFSYFDFTVHGFTKKICR